MPARFRSSPKVFQSMPGLAPGLRPCLLAGLILFATLSLAGCKRSDPPPDPLKSQRDAMERAKDVGNTMQKGVDAEGKKADEESK